MSDLRNGLQLSAFLAFGLLLSSALIPGFSLLQNRQLTAFATTSSDSETGEFLTYENQSQAFSINYPDNWEKSEISAGGASMTGTSVIFASPLSDAIVTVALESLYFKPVTLDEYTKASLSSLEKEVSLLKIEQSEPTSVAGLSGHKVVYSGLLTFFGDTLVNVKAMQVWTVVGNSRAYVITYIALPDSFDKNLPIADKMVDSFAINTNEVPKRIEGTYENADLGLSIELPPGWVGIADNSFLKELPFDNAIIILPEFEKMAQLTNSSMTGSETNVTALTSQLLNSIVVIGSIDTGDLLHGKLGKYNEKEEHTCDTTKSASIISLNGVKAMKVEGTCFQSTLEKDYHLTGYVIMTQKDTVFIAFFGAPGSEQNLAKFENALNTLKLKGAIDLSDIAEIAAFEKENRKVTTQTAYVDKKPYDLSILTNSTISEFKMNETMKQISFKVEGEPNTLGSVEMELGEVLKGPYTVLVDGSPVDDTFVVDDTTTNKTTLSFTYPHSTHSITVTGTTVVPELGGIVSLIAAIGVGMAIIGCVIIQRRFKSSLIS